ncbi:IclR family transcriptional regulator [Saccharothrix sp. ALI-22-I]|uniref:IclR family transcriptional regulator n=1 Tax=Saccharothrix sp. ALI-22-I TaxID=1933778 RepID=UPI00097C7908|nr:IclR family transcriptional regulator [Saccharothrix sp. ALI-22-I]ONI88875.1 IclR family transcriptional regulator [Saccharothrix sp. ALI-22-I]
MGNDEPSASSTIQSVDRALTVLSLLARHGELGVTEIAARLDVHKSTAFRLVTTLELHELVEQNTDRGKYRLGIGVLQLAGATTARLDVVQRGRPIIRRLAEELGETVNITVLSGHEALYLDQAAGNTSLRPNNWVGQRVPLHATSNGKALLAHVSEQRFAELTAEPLHRFTDRTTTDVAALKAEVQAAARDGYAVAVDELEIGLTAVAAPIVGPGGEVVGSVSASGPTFRIPARRIPDVAAKVVEAAGHISRRLGWHGLPEHS